VSSGPESPGFGSPSPRPPERSLPVRLGKNQGAYRGEGVHIERVLEELALAARPFGWREERMEAENGLVMPAWILGDATAPHRLYLSAGIHGDEPAGPLALRELVRINSWPANLGVWMCPCLNPSGFSLNQRESVAGFDLNRQYLHLDAAETRAHVNWLERQPSFDVALCLHEDWEAHGFYLYELNPDQRPSHAEEIIRIVAQHCPVDLSPQIEGRAAQGGIVRPSVDPESRHQWPEAFYLLNRKTRHSYTLEAPSDFALEVRVQALVRSVEVVLDGWR
jgi:murein peptide amidase A